MQVVEDEVLENERSMPNPIVRRGCCVQVVEDEVLENERSMPFQGFKPNQLLPLDPKRYPCLLYTSPSPRD